LWLQRLFLSVSAGETLPPRARIDQHQQIGAATMALFKTSPKKILITAIGARDKLRTRLADAEAAVGDLRSEAERLALDGATDDALSAAEGKTRVMIDRTATLRPSLSKAEAEVSRLEAARDEAADMALREATGAEVELLAREVCEDADAFVKAAAKLADSSLRASVIVPEAGGIVQFSRAAISEIPAGADLTGRLLRNHRAAVLDHRAPATLAQPPAAYSAPVPTALPLTQVFLLHACKWKDHGGTQRQSAKWRDIEVSAAQAETALRLKLATTMSDPRRKQLHPLASGNAEKSWLNDLDAMIGPNIPKPEDGMTAIDPIKASEPPTTFTAVDRGPPITLRVAR
jgi:hypothetical protein